jgi:hypothetical protein
MFDDNFFAVNIIGKIFSNGKIDADEPIFRDFNNFLQQLGLDVVLSTFHLKPWNEKQYENSENGNSLGVYLRTTANFEANGFTDEGNWGGSYANTELIKVKWKELAQQYGLPVSYYNHISYVWVYDFEKLYLSLLQHHSKAELIKKIKKAKWKVKPEYVFGSSVPAYRIIYEDQKSYDIASTKGYFQEIKDLANRILVSNDKFQMFKEGSVKIKFYHIEMNDINLYGFSRED